MAYDLELAELIRELVVTEPGITEKKMFGGLAFLVHGKMAIAVSGQGGVMVRVDRETAQDLVESTSAEVVVMRGRPMSGWLRVQSDALRTREAVVPWVRLGVDYVRTLPTT